MYRDLVENVKALAIEVSEIANIKGRVEIHQKGAKDFVTEVDLKISECLCRRLPELLEDSMVISEEGYKGKPDNHLCWIIDPVDGTNNFIYRHPDYAISIGLLEDGEPVLGVIYAPAHDEMFWAVKGEGAYCNDRKISVCSDEAIANTMILAETNPYAKREENRFTEIFSVVYRDCIDYRITGSAAIDCCYIACGRSGGFVAECLKPWDYAAGVLIISEAGGKMTLWDGSELPYFGNSNLIAGNPAVFEELKGRMKAFV